MLLPVTLPLIFKVAIAMPVNRLFDYLAPVDFVGLDSIKPGVRVEVPFGKAKKIAFLIAIVKETDVPTEKLKSVLRILDSSPLLSPKDLKLLHWASHYYHYPLGEVISTAFPAGLRQGKIAKQQQLKKYALTKEGNCFDTMQLNRAPKQKIMLELFKERQAIAQTDILLQSTHVRSAIKHLIAKQLITLTETPENQVTDIKVTQLLNESNRICNSHQQQALDQITAKLDKFSVFLLEGVTGSGKTEVYMQVIQAVLAKHQQILVLVPEITLTPQLEERFRQRFAVTMAVTHSRLTDNQRQNTWLQIQQGQSNILLGTRSALFTPFKNLGLIILDEEHDSSFKQQEGFRFSARDVAVVRGKLMNIPVVLGSATPSLESIDNVNRKRYQLLQLPERAGNATAPDICLLDIRNKKMQGGISEQLLVEIQKTLQQQQQVLLFLNRRGFAPTLICHSCAWVARCSRCDANLVVHANSQKLRCHHCDSEQLLIETCPACKSSQLAALGLGTERVEKILTELFPDKVVIRLDRDSTQRKGVLEDYLEQINQKKVDIILGTQMLAKGHHFANVTLVAILDVDSGLFSIDFHALEKLAQMVIQVAGRAGRAEKAGKVMLQTRKPDHPLLTMLIQDGYHRFAETALAERQQALLPPFSYHALLRAHSSNADQVQTFLQQVVSLIKSEKSGSIQIMGPIPAPMARRAGNYRYQLLLQANKRACLHRFLDNYLPQIEQLKQAKQVRWSLDIDPVDLY